MKKWEKPGLAMLNAGDTKETRDFPHYYKCNTCGKHNVGTLIIFNPKTPCEYCGSTEGYTETLKPQYGGVIIPEFGDNKPSLTPTVS